MHLKTCSVLALSAFLASPALAQRSGKAPKPNFEVNGKLHGVPGGTKVYVLDLNGGQKAVLDSAAVDATGKFTLRGRVAEPAVYYLGVAKDKQALGLPLGPGSKLQVAGDGTRMAETGTVRGSVEAEIYSRYQQAQMRDAEQMQKLGNTPAPDQASRAALQKQYEDLLAQASSRTRQLARQPSYLAPFAALRLLSNEAHAAFLDSATAVYQKLHPLSRYTRQLLEYRAAQKATAVGALAPDIQLANPEGKTIALSSLRGKYVMVDFWASWCGPCRKENPNVARLYQQYQPKGFEIFGVSLDEDKNKWLKAIETDKLSWPQVSDLKGWQSAAGQTYGVRGIPATVLIDPQGRIVAKGLRGEDLEKKLAELLP